MLGPELKQLAPPSRQQTRAEKRRVEKLHEAARREAARETKRTLREIDQRRRALYAEYGLDPSDLAALRARVAPGDRRPSSGKSP